jgi:O-succinylbenzoate synthase
LAERIEYWRYELKPKRRLNAVAAKGNRQGALIRAGDGFADVHPWPELGDATLDEQLALLVRGETTTLTRASLSFAAIDAAARRAGRSLFDGITIPGSHWPGSDPPAGFDTVKLKRIDLIPDGHRLRIDFNATLTPAEFLRIAESLPRERIDFIEDPCVYDPATWRQLRAQSGLRLALDRAGAARDDDSANAAGFDVLVIKPAVQPMPGATEAEVIVTSYMDHPIGQLSAAYCAAAAGITTTCGLVTHVLFENDSFMERMRIDGTRLVPPAGHGFGFDDLLATLPWKRLT